MSNSDLEDDEVFFSLEEMEKEEKTVYENNRSFVGIVILLAVVLGVAVWILMWGVVVTSCKLSGSVLTYM